ncbi:hypothetical protein [Micromonospora ureilytica]|uniref:DUF4145 domain-containing protein n=1 Tax=Micromonospora ureilytica TaxID=709868 RepID=A0ABS0JSM7_9ACTN|nr:hypothetical protein [Micromonospora ureilytica]MBG6070049.1 hypothetical protein [Micromonospora ureilytica]WSR56732.1 hypothetical protein OG400_00430 [Micromonospora ureilytica]
MTSLRSQATEQFKVLEALYNDLDQRRTYDDFSGGDITVREYVEFSSACLAFIHRVAGDDSVYAKQAASILKTYAIANAQVVPRFYGIVGALKRDIDMGFTQDFAEIAHADVFSDILEMAEHLLAEGYKDPAAVLAGGALESHLKKLAAKHGVDIEENSSSGLRPKRAERLNQDLTKASVYNLLQQKTITSWLDLRNKAAHANYDDYTIEQVRLLSMGVQDFMSRHPA